MPEGYSERSKMGVERYLGAANGSLYGAEWGLLLERMGYKFAQFGQGGVSERRRCASFVGLLVQRGANDGGHKMGKV